MHRRRAGRPHRKGMDNLPLRQHLAETLLGYGRLDEAEKELRDAISTG